MESRLREKRKPLREQFTRQIRSGERATQHPEKHVQKLCSTYTPTRLLLMTPHLKLYHIRSTKKNSRVRRETAVIGGLYAIVLLIELEHFIGVPSIGLKEKGECFKTQEGKQQ